MGTYYIFSCKNKKYYYSDTPLISGCHFCCSLVDPLAGYEQDDFYKIMAKYKFTLAMENALCDDYVTEKLWRPFMLGSVPVIAGSSKVRVSMTQIRHYFR